ncbi:MAG: 30S ribosomal protein S16 [Alphaproteobacteria bacterium]|nr:MAG: 30S ribosomal protein S16 [Rickettsiaceae bacterium 4572_127]
MIKLRLSRAGAKKRPYYKIVVADVRSPRDGKFIEKVGTYNPMVAKDSAERLILKKDRIEHWLKQGAQPTDRVAHFLATQGLGEKPETPKHTKKHLPKAKAQERLKAKEEKAKADAEAKKQAKEEAKAEKEASVETPKEEKTEAPVEAPKEEKTEAPVEAPKEEKTEEKPAE